MKNLEIAKILRDIADLLEMKEVQFKPQAYRKAANTIETLSKDIEAVVAEGELEELPGIGTSIAKKIREYLETGTIEYYEKLKKEFPIDFAGLLAVEGIGPKTAKQLYEELGIKGLDELEHAAKEHKIRDLEGMGEKSEQKILHNIAFARKDTGRKLLGFILPIAEELENKMKQLEYVERISIAGSLRRRKETIGDIDILVQTTEPTKVMDHFTQLENVQEIIVKGTDKTTVRLHEGLDADLRVIEAVSFGAALLYFTGSKALGIELRKMALKNDWKLNEYGLYKGKEVLASKTEKAIFHQYGMDYIEPELRENRGEIEAAMNGKLPKLIGYDALLGDLQMHTKWSDGSYTILEMAQAAKAMGHKYIAITDHTGSLRIAGGLKEKDVYEQMKEIDQVNDQIEGITILKGLEVNIDSRGQLDISNEVLKEMDIVVAAIHSGFRQEKSQLTERMISAMENEYVNIIAHPTGRKILSREEYDLDWDKIYEKSKETNTFLEINSQPNRLDLNDIRIKEAIDFDCKLVINTDAHSTEHLRYIQLGLATARRGWAEKEDIINTLSLQKLRKVLK
ncbi:MAG: DNA polymerase/3'-5' exonuclease PolX [Candidatus Heimdallarchaeota archaeon]|nr:DNA polymerase/3'-5' exonuclease PolX [Candidatus Heimdallarchaeota archaeon]